jgi:parvulin-like peptidyl-prolyl isomerase
MKSISPFKSFTCRIVLGIAALLALGPGSVQAASDVVDGVAALVNDDVITFSQVREVVAPRERALRASLSGQELVDKVREARKGALQDLIDRQLILQEFKKKEFQIPQQFIDEHVNSIIRDEFGGDRQAFVRTLQAQGYTLTKFQNAERDKIIVQAMRYSNVKSDDFLVSPNKIEGLYSTSKDQFTTPEQVHLWMIAISKGTPAPGDQDPQKAMAEEIRGKLLKGTKFDQLATMYSEDSSKQVGGDWGMVDRKTLNEKLTNTAFGLKVNTISPVIAEGNSYYILKVTEHKDAVTKPLDDVRDDLEKKLAADERQRMQEHWIEGLRAKAFIKTF